MKSLSSLNGKLIASGDVLSISKVLINGLSSVQLFQLMDFLKEHIGYAIKDNNQIICDTKIREKATNSCGDSSLRIPNKPKGATEKPCVSSIIPEKSFRTKMTVNSIINRQCGLFTNSRTNDVWFDDCIRNGSNNEQPFFLVDEISSNANKCTRSSMTINNDKNTAPDQQPFETNLNRASLDIRFDYKNKSKGALTDLMPLKLPFKAQGDEDSMSSQSASSRESLCPRNVTPHSKSLPTVQIPYNCIVTSPFINDKHTMRKGDEQRFPKRMYNAKRELTPLPDKLILSQIVSSTTRINTIVRDHGPRGWQCSYKACGYRNDESHRTCARCLSYRIVERNKVMCTKCGYVNNFNRSFCKKCTGQIAVKSVDLVSSHHCFQEIFRV